MAKLSPSKIEVEAPDPQGLPTADVLVAQGGKCRLQSALPSGPGAKNRDAFLIDKNGVQAPEVVAKAPTAKTNSAAKKASTKKVAKPAAKKEVDAAKKVAPLAPAKKKRSAKKAAPKVAAKKPAQRKAAPKRAASASPAADGAAASAA